MTRSPAYCLPVDGNGERTVARLARNGLSKHNERDPRLPGKGIRRGDVAGAVLPLASGERHRRRNSDDQQY